MHALDPSIICLTEYSAFELFEFEKERKGWMQICVIIKGGWFLLFEQWTSEHEEDDL